MGVSISYALTAKDELEELQKLLQQITSYIRDEDEIVIQLDTTASSEVKNYLELEVGLPYIEFPLNKDFASFKNNLKDHCLKEMIVFLDADELLSEALIRDLPEILELNPDIDLYGLARVNTVEGLTQEWINKWGWRVDDKGRINYMDPQYRVVKNVPYINWEGKVHERLKGALCEILLPDDGYHIIHHKTLEKQISQNELYNTI